MNPLIHFLRLGIPESSDPMESRRVVFINLFYLVATVTVIASIVESILIREPRAMQFVLVAALLLLIAVPLLARKNSYYAALYLMFLANVMIFYFSNVQGFESGTYLFFFPMFFINAWLMDFRKPWYSLTLVVMTMAGIISVIAFPESLFGFTITPEQLRVSFFFALVTSAFSTAVNTFVVVWMNNIRQSDLDRKSTEKEEANKKLSEVVREKEVLLAEIHHRVKNNLAVVRGLLNLQLNSTTSETARVALRESVNRVTAMALIHQKLYTNSNADAIDLHRFATELVTEVAASYHVDGKPAPKVNISVQRASLDLNRAVPCGLILNELLTNAFKHAFSNGKQGLIEVKISTDKNDPHWMVLSVSDNGQGLNDGFIPDKQDSLGMTIIGSLSEQLDGKFSITGKRDKGTNAVIRFPSFAPANSKSVY